MIEIKNLSKSFGNNLVLDNVSMSFDYGRVYGIMGENGAGKTTLFQCILNFIHYTGNVLFPDHTTIGYLPDTPFFYSFVTGREFLVFFIKSRNKNAPVEEINELNKNFALPLDEYASSYSMGMKKKLYLMALILQKSDFYILDEPFNGLDLAGSIILKNWIRILKSEGKTIFFSSHIISVMTDVCDKIYFLHEGKIKHIYDNQSASEIENDIIKYI